ncbi:MAG: peptidase M14, partial [Marinomonas atlantica]|nr:peptidase M14 [Marinomonas atlantica]
MTHIFSTHIKPTVDELIETFGTPEYKGQFIEAWLFEDKKRRKTAEVELLKYGVNAKFRSAYKPLLHFFLEDLDAESKDLSHIEVHYPLHPNAYEKRFLLEMYPLSALINETEINYVAHTKNIDVYDVMV